MPISPDLYRRLHATLLHCAPFESHEALAALFVDARINRWQFKIPEANNREARVSATIAYLAAQATDQGENALVLLLRVLSDRVESTSSCHTELTALADELDHDLLAQGTSIISPPSALDRLFDWADVPLNLPLYEKLGHLLMTSLAQLNEQRMAVVTQLLALVILTAFFSRWLIQDALWRGPLWQPLTVLWLGLVILPLFVAFLPQQRARDLRRRHDLNNRQKLALGLERVAGAYIGAFLGDALAVFIWLGLYYLGIWEAMRPAVRTVFIFVMLWPSLLLAFVGEVIALKYMETRLEQESKTGILHAQQFILALGFPLIVFPTLIWAAWLSLPLWQSWQSGCIATALLLIILTWQLHRSAKTP